MDGSLKKTLVRILTALVLFAIIMLLPVDRWFESPTNVYVEFGLFLIPYLLAGYDVLARAFHGITHGQVLDENFLMTIATIGAFALVFFPESEPHMAEGAAVMLFYQVGELFQDYAVGKSRKSIAEMMDIAPDYANIMRDGTLIEVDPYDVEVGDQIVIKPGERIPLDGAVLEGHSQLDTMALTGESIPRSVEPGAEAISGCVNMTGLLTVKVTKPAEESTVSRILELVENASEKKARTENFITRFARFYTPIVVGLALALALLPPLFVGRPWSECVQSALVFLVVSCPCALVISVPLSFFGGIGAASRIGVLVKGSSCLEALAKVDTVVFDKTGTLTNGTFKVVEVHTQDDATQDQILDLAAHAEAFSDHPIAQSIRTAYGKSLETSRVANVFESSGRGVSALIDGQKVSVGNTTLLAEQGICISNHSTTGTVAHVCVDDTYLGFIVIADEVKNDAQETIRGLHQAGVSKTVMLTGDRLEVASAVANELGIDEFHAQLLPQEKVAWVERLLDECDNDSKLAFAGDGINDAPVLMRADIGIAMGAMGSDAAIEAADVVLMDDKPSKIARAIEISRKTKHIVLENIVFAIGVKVIIMILALPFIGIANIWIAVFGDVGVACLAILNAMRTMHVKK